jgi:hypothetical protein
MWSINLPNKRMGIMMENGIVELGKRNMGSVGFVRKNINYYNLMLVYTMMIMIKFLQCKAIKCDNIYRIF